MGGGGERSERVSGERGKRKERVFFFFCCVAVEVFFALSERERESAGRFRARIVSPLEKEFAPPSRALSPSLSIVSFPLSFLLFRRAREIALSSEGPRAEKDKASIPERKRGSEKERERESSIERREQRRRENEGNKKRATSSCTSLLFLPLETACCLLCIPQRAQEKQRLTATDEERGKRRSAKGRIYRKKLAAVSPFRRFSHVDGPAPAKKKKRSLIRSTHRSSRPSGGRRPGSPGHRTASESPVRARGGRCRPRRGARSRSGTRPRTRRKALMQRPRPKQPRRRRRRRGSGGPRAASSTPRQGPEGPRAGTRRSARPVPRATGTW